MELRRSVWSSDPVPCSQISQTQLAALARQLSTFSLTVRFTLTGPFHLRLSASSDAGCVVIRDCDAHLRAFSERPDYLAANERGIAAGSPWPVDFGPELSRGYRALKVWSHILEHGAAKLGAAISRNCEHAAHLAALVDEASELERMAPTSLNIVVFRYHPARAADVAAAAAGSTGDAAAATAGEWSDAELDALNDALVVELQLSGVAAPSTTRINGRLAIRCNITNHRTRFTDLDLLVAEVRKVGAVLACRMGPNAAA